MQEFTSSTHNQFGMHIVVLAVFIDGDGDPVVTLCVWGIIFTHISQLNSFDYNEKNGGTSFKACHPDWRQDLLMDDFMKWGAESFSESLFHLKKFVLMHLHFRGLTGRQ